MWMIRILKITVTPILMLLLLGACSKKPLIEQSSIEVRSKEVVSIEAVKGYERYSWRQISGMPVEIEDAKSRILRFIAPDVTQKEELVFELGAYTGNIELKAEAKVTVLPLNSDIDKEDENGTQESEEDNATDKESGTSPIQSLTLHIKKSSLNKDTNTTYTLTAKYRDGKKETVSENIEWIITPKDAIKIEGSTITAIKDTDVTIQARYKGRVSDPITLHIYWEVDGYRLPPEPDPKINNATLLGVDSNNNGVRDDVERWIYRTYKEYIPCKDVPVSYKLDSGEILEGYEKVCEGHPVPYHPVVREAVMEIARQVQTIIQEPKKAQETVLDFTKAFGCASALDNFHDNSGRKIRNKNLFGKDFKSIQFNTVQRTRAYAEFNYYLSGGIFEVPSDEYILNDWCSPKIKEMIKGLR